MDLMHISKFDDYQMAHRQWLDNAISNHQFEKRQANFSEALSIVSADFLSRFKASMPIEQTQRKIVSEEGDYVIREFKASYTSNLDRKMNYLSGENTCFWEVL